MRTSMIAAALLLLGTACGGSSGTEPKPIDNSKPAGSQSDEDATIQRAQFASCRPVCERLIDCSVQDLHREKSDAEIAEVNLPETVPKAIDDCESTCRQKSLSPRQINVMQECVNGPQDCGAYVTCLDRAKRAP